MNDLQPIDDGIAEADGPEYSREKADVDRWFTRLEATRKFDEEARKQYAKDRRYARGDSGFEVDANIIGTFIDVSESFLYAKQPDVDVMPAKSAEAPTVESMLEAAETTVADSPEVMAAGKQAFALAVYSGVPVEQALPVGAAAEEATAQQMIGVEFERLQKAYADKQRDAKAFAETMELIVSHLWRQAHLKRRGRKWVRSALTIGLGVVKASFQHRTGPAPETVSAINDLQDNIKRAARLRADMDEASGSELDAKTAEYQRQLEALKGKAELVLFRGFVVDPVRGEDFTVAPGYAISDFLDAPWVSHRIPMLYEDAKAFCDVPEDKLKSATRFTARKPEAVRTSTAMLDGAIEADEADAFTAGHKASGGDRQGGEWVMLEEIWDRDTGTVLTGIWGVACWVKAPWRPKATTRFYPFFTFTTSEVDGERHPQSLVSRSAKLVDEYNRIGSAEAEHRRRVRPKTMFNAGAMDTGEAKKLAKATTQEMVPVKTTVPKTDLRGLLVPVTYAALDPGLYDRTRIVNELERIWGVQEALSGGVTVDKTATEAEIQQGGFQARTGGRRDLLETALTELAHYTAEVAHAELSHEEVIEICGPTAFWPPYSGPDDLKRMVSVEIRAGSSGKPNTSAERQAWATLLPMLTQSITTIAQLRGSTPADLADSHEKLLRMTVERAGERIDVEQLLPKAAPMQPMVPGMPMPGAPVGAPMDPMQAATEPQPAPMGEPAV